MTTEQTFYADESGVRITNTRAIFNSTTYSMANISSIRSASTPAKRGFGIFLALLGFIVLIIGASSSATVAIVIGLIMLAIGILLAWAAKGEYHIMITSSSGEASALKSKNRGYIDRIAQAMNEAIIHRG